MLVKHSKTTIHSEFRRFIKMFENDVEGYHGMTEAIFDVLTKESDDIIGLLLYFTFKLISYDVIC